MITFGYLERLSWREEIYARPSLSGITQEIHIWVQEVSIDKFSIH